MDETKKVIIVVVLVGVAILVVAKWSVNHFRILGNPYRMEEGGSRSETNDECLQSPGYRFCMMTDGTPGVCMLSGQCVPDIMQDLRTVRDELNLPYCTKPVFKTGCNRYCRCRNMAKGRPDYIENVGKCTKECEDWYSPL